MTAEEGPHHSLGGFLRRHKRAVAIVGAVALVLVISVGGYGFYLNSQLGNFDYYNPQLQERQRAQQPTGEAAEAQNILLLGTDKGTGGSIEEELADGEWSTGAFRSDTIMIVHIPASRDEAFLVSIPRDSYVEIPDHGKDKINAAFSLGGPDLTTRTVEDLTGVYIDHVAMIDWAGFRDLTHAIGGVEVTVAETFTDPHKNITWEEGTHVLEGQEALAYVRTRYGLEQGDFDRIKRQQNFLRAAMRKSISRGTLANPIKLTNLLRAVTDATTVDSGWTVGEMRGLALDLRDIDAKDVTYLTAPTKGTKDTEVGNVVVLDRKEGEALWEAVRDDDIEDYLQEYGGDTLQRADKVR
jgi:LCP family protein required for cell wall assembly